MFDAIIQLPWIRFGIRTRDDRLVATEFLGPDCGLFDPAPGSLAAEVVRQLSRYVDDAAFRVDLPMENVGTEHQQAVWQCMMNIPVGEVRSYGDVARELGSSAQAVGNACHANNIPILVPCHRVVAARSIGGFSGDREGGMVNVKRELLQHEGFLSSLF